MRIFFGRAWPIFFTTSFVGLAWALAILSGVGGAELANSENPQWSIPQAMTIRKVSPVTGSQSQPNTFSNMDCQSLTYRTPSDPTMVTGCFTQTAYGLLDTDSGMAIFNGTDEAVPLFSKINREVLIPWPRSLALLGIDTVNTGGGYVHLYKNALNLSTSRDALLRITSKNLLSLPDITLKDSSGQPLVINSQTIAFSSNGSWMVAETLNGKFIRINLATLEQKAFAPSMSAPGIPATLKSGVAVSDDGRYVVVQNVQSDSFGVYDLSRCSDPSRCDSYNYRSFALSQIEGFVSFRHIRFINEGLLSFEALTTKSSSSGTYLLAPSAAIESLTDYIGLGDSYTSGEGAFNYRSGTDTTENQCHTSVHAYPELLTSDLFSSAGGHSVACSGARIHDLADTSANYHGQVGGGMSFADLQKNQPSLLSSILTNYLPGYVSQRNFVKKYSPRIITVSVGGNDIGFGDIVKTCAAPHIKTGNSCFNTYEDRIELENLINRTGKKWEALFKQLAGDSPLSRIYAVGYPEIASSSGSCALNVRLDESERIFTNEVVEQLNAVIARSAKNAKIEYVDVSQALKGHRLCETTGSNVAVNGLTTGKDGGVFGLSFLGKESYHPNKLGHELIEQEILRRTQNLSSSFGSSPAVAVSFGDKPKSGRAVSTLVSAKIISDDKVGKGQAITVSLDGADLGLSASTEYKVVLDRGATVLGSVISELDGSIHLELVIPIPVTTGVHNLQIMGQGQGGAITINQPVYVLDSSDNFDGDAQDNTTDSCPFIHNSGVDQDEDDIDDACDGLVDEPSGTSFGFESPPLPPSSSLSPESTPIHPPRADLSAPTGNASSALTAGSSISALQNTISPTSYSQNLKMPRISTTKTASSMPQLSSPQLLGAKITKPTAPPVSKKISWYFWVIITLWLWWLLAALAVFIKDRKDDAETAPLVKFSSDGF